ncbi:hypothetical protein ACHAXR_006382, partial [Thalassiosira sp. AJA248-18]
VSSSLLRCAQCRSAWYCDRECQSLAWTNPSKNEDGKKKKEGHRKACRRLRKLLTAAATADATAAASAVGKSSAVAPAAGTGDEVNEAMVELMEKVQTMDCNEAYKQMCLAQDEIKRLQLEIKDGSKQEILPEILNTTSRTKGRIDNNNSNEKAKTAGCGETGNNNDTSNKITTKPTTPREQINTSSKPVHVKYTSEKYTTASGSWPDQGGRCSIEFLPNVKCYQITLTVAEDDSLSIPLSKDDLHFSMTPLDGTNGIQSAPLVSYYEAKLYRSKDTTSLSPSSPVIDRGQNDNLELLLSIILPISSSNNIKAESPNARLSIDSNSISIRIQLQHEPTAMATDSMDLMDNLLGMEDSSFTPITTSKSHLNYLRCRSCQNPIIVPPSKTNDDANGEDGSAIIQSVLPLPAGYWDDISDYLICYDGQATVDFTSSSTSAIPKIALEDDAILVLHKQDLAEGGGVRAVGVKGYGEHSSDHLNNGSRTGASQAWKDKSAVKGERAKTVTCANCFSTLGFVSDHDINTYRLYKHLLDCGTPASGGKAAVDEFSKKYSCGSFLAREMVRYAESEAVYTFIVGISDENDWTRVHNSGEYILLRILSWDTPMAAVGGLSNHSAKDDSVLHRADFQKVVKVIFEETTDKRSELTTVNDDPLEWTWRGTDFCCLPPVGSNSESLGFDEVADAALQTKASSIRIFFSKQEWSELRDALICGSHYFSETVKDAVVMTKLGVPSSDQEQPASLSVLPLVS